MPIDLSKDRKLGAPFQAAQVVKERTGLTGWRFPVYLVVDHSGSMRRFFANGHVQHLGERVLALAAHFDDDGSVPVVFFDSYARKPVPIRVDAYDGAIERIKATAGAMGTTNYIAAMDMVMDLHLSTAGDVPGLVVFQTDGAPDRQLRRATTQKVCDFAKKPLFWQFIGFGDEGEVLPGEGARFDFLRTLNDELPVPSRRVVDNAGFFPAGADPSGVPDSVLYDNLLGEFPQWAHAYSAYRNSLR